MNHVYIIGPLDGPFKVGVSSNVVKRLQGLQTGCPMPLTIHYSLATEEAYQLEGRFHKKHALKATCGEWVSMPIAEIISELECGCPYTPDEPVIDEAPCTPNDITQWRETLGISRAEACRRLGLSLNTWTKYQEGRTEIPRYVALACAAIMRGLKPWPE